MSNNVQIKREVYTLQASKDSIHRVKKRILSMDIFIPLFNQTGKYELHICNFEPNIPLELENDTNYGAPIVDNYGIRKELEEHLNDKELNNSEMYFTSKLFIDRKQQPLFYHLLLNSPHTMENYQKFNKILEALRPELADDVINGALRPDYYFGFANTILLLGRIIYESIAKIKENGYLNQDTINKLSFENAEKRLDLIKDKITHKYFETAWNSFVAHLIEHSLIKKCPECETFFAYKNNKVYCTPLCRKRLKDREAKRRNK
ncbi:MAG: hypothetical protein ACK5N8_06000 [Alphaproteobacteria bacterium]